MRRQVNKNQCITIGLSMPENRSGAYLKGASRTRAELQGSEP